MCLIKYLILDLPLFKKKQIIRTNLIVKCQLRENQLLVM